MNRLTTKVANPITHKDEVILKLGMTKSAIDSLAYYEDLEAQGKLHFALCP